MKQGSEYAKRVKKLFQQTVRKPDKPAAEEAIDPLDQLIIAILSGCTSSSKAQAVYRRLRLQMVDLNELRVTPPMELAKTIGDSVPLASEKARRIVDALNAIRRRQDSLDLGFLKQRGRREAREYLESLAGVDRAAAASVVLYSLGGHAIPVDELTLYVLQKEQIVDPGADVAEVQGFLERHISAADARAFADALNRYVSTRGARVPVEKLRSRRPAAPAAPVQNDGEKLESATAVVERPAGRTSSKIGAPGDEEAVPARARPADRKPPPRKKK